MNPSPICAGATAPLLHAGRGCFRRPCSGTSWPPARRTKTTSCSASSAHLSASPTAFAIGSLKGDVDYFANRNHTLTLGFLATLFEFDYSQSFNQRGRDLVPEVGVGLGLRPRRVAGRAAHAAAVRRTRHLFQRRGSPALHASAVPQPRLSDNIRVKAAAGMYRQYLQLITSRSLQRRRFLGATRRHRRARPLISGGGRHGVEPVATLPTLGGGLLHRLGQFGGAGQRGWPSIAKARARRTYSKAGAAAGPADSRVFLQRRTGALTGWIGYTLGWTRAHFLRTKPGTRLPAQVRPSP